MSKQPQDSDEYRKALDAAIRQERLVPRNKGIDPLKTEFDEHLFVIGQLTSKLKMLGVGSGLVSRLQNVRFDSSALKLTQKEKHLLERRDVDETIYRIQQSIAALELLAPPAPGDATLAKDRLQFEKRVSDDEARKEFVARWKKTREQTPEQER